MNPFLLIIHKKRENILIIKHLCLLKNVNNKFKAVKLTMTKSCKIAKKILLITSHLTMKNKQPIFIAFFLAAFSFTVSAQQSVTVSGNTATGAGGSANYSVGQVAYTTNYGTNGNLTQGVQQSYEISTLGTDEHSEINLQFLAYPNPTTDVLTLSIGNFNSSDLIYSLFDINGRVIQSKKITESLTNIDMKNQQSAIYFLKITADNKEIKTYRIIKK